MNEKPEWMMDEEVRKIPAEKLEFLEQMFHGGHGKSQKELMAFCIPMLQQARQKNLIFTQEELKIAITAIKNHSTPTEVTKMNEIIQKVQNKSSKTSKKEM